MSRVFVKPVAGRTVAIEGRRPIAFWPTAGMETELTRYVQRCLDRGDLVIEAATPPAVTAKKE